MQREDLFGRPGDPVFPTMPEYDDPRLFDMQLRSAPCSVNPAGHHLFPGNERCRVPIIMRGREHSSRLMGGNWEEFQLRCRMNRQARDRSDRQHAMFDKGVPMNSPHIGHNTITHPSPMRQPHLTGLLPGYHRGPNTGHAFAGQ